MGWCSSMLRWYTGASLLLISIAAPKIAHAQGDGVLLSPSYAAGKSDVNLVDYRPQCACERLPSCPTCPSCPYGEEGMVTPSPSDATVPQADMPPSDSFADEQFAAGLGLDSWSINSSPGGYIDNPIVATWFRARYDVAVNDPNPDLAEFFYAQWADGNPGGPGPPSPTGRSPSHANYQLGSFYFELLLFPRLSAFVDLQIQRTDMFFNNGLNDPTIVKNGGIGDTISGFKYALLIDEVQYLTAQLKIYSPTGDAARGLGTGHTSLEPGLLYLRRLSDRAYLQGELRYWIPVDGSIYAGDLLRYGLGVGYDLWQSCDGADPLNPYISEGTRITGVFEVVAWSVFNGKFTPPNTAAGAVGVDVPDGFTVVNVKPGIRYTHGLGSLYFGAGIAVSGDRWYSDLLRVEYRRMF